MTRWTRLVALPLVLLLAAATAVRAQTPTITTYAGGGLPTAGPATATGIARAAELPAMPPGICISLPQPAPS